MGADEDRADELLRRVRELEARTRERVTENRPRAAHGSGASLREALSELSWLAGATRRARRILDESAQVIDRILRWTGPLQWVLRGTWSGARFVAHRASHVRVDGDAFEFSPRRTARSLLALLVAPLVAYAVYNATTRRTGVFLINDKHLVSGESDEYQMGGCWKRNVDQASCERGEGEIVLIRPAWVPQTGIFSVTYDEVVGVVPFQGSCELRTYGIYLRMPWMPFLRGALKPVAIGIGDCQGVGVR